jgi:hypothetical protein
VEDEQFLLLYDSFLQHPVVSHPTTPGDLLNKPREKNTVAVFYLGDEERMKYTMDTMRKPDSLEDRALTCLSIRDNITDRIYNTPGQHH